MPQPSAARTGLRSESQSAARRAGVAAVLSGLIGVAALCALMAAVFTRSTWVILHRNALLFRAHDVGVTLQFLLLLLLVPTLAALSRERPHGLGKAAVGVGIGAVLLVALLLVLGIAKVVDDMFYMLPQGVYGVWMIVVSWRLGPLLPRPLRWFGIFVGLGLALVGTVFPGLALLVYPSMLRIPAAPQESMASHSTINLVLHRMLAIGSLMGVLTLPFWSIWIGRLLLRRGRQQGPAAAPQ